MIRARTIKAVAALVAGAMLAGQAQPQAQRPRNAGSGNIVIQERPIPFMPATKALFDGYVREGKMPGIVAAFGTGNLPTRFVSAGRIATDPTAAAASPDTLWRVYSMTKPVTAMAAMILVEEGKISLDQPISDFLPAFRKMRVQLDPNTMQSRPATQPITVRNLLTHTAGLGYNIITKGPLLKEYERLGILPAAINAGVEPQMRRVRPPTLQEFAGRVATLPLIADPGTKWSYSIGLDVMGAVIEKASGMPFDQFVQTRLFVPLDMRSSYWTVPAGETSRLATNYTFLGDSLVPVDPAATSVYLARPSFPYGGAGLVTSARDYDRFLRMLADGGALDGVRVMKPETVRLAMSNLLPAGVTFGGVGGGTGGTDASVPMGYGAGGSVYLADGPGGVPSKGTYGWGGAAGTVAFVDPAKRIRGTIMVNYFPADRWPVREEAVRAFGRDLALLAGR
ncbi:serine hydrolase domain-containing protein [Sphingomonas aerophila]|uniref:CubicO group peptidase (Beta-lactamase class C family) n=1 Tax=Sphingomonas aerophila TaxID=1344948 RepID=A0A7W9ESM2_9SPHN|nr:serine hydrolase domain-containing protein [Sphingomonas aerophila]MBB5713271.1 CubicO group peptidase (beta-lactamase class C family) [Sphingomonas aerophila]